MKKELIEFGTKLSAGATGGWVGGIVGTAIAGPLGSVLGALAGAGMEYGLTTIGDYMSDALSKNEVQKVLSALDYATKRYKERILAGDIPRNDGFFDNKEGERSDDKEVLEGIIYASQREFEEKKIKYIGIMYANIAFRDDISRTEANQLIRVAEDLSYKQLCLIASLAIIQKSKQGGVNLALKKAFQTISGYSKIALATELFGLYTSGYISSSSAIFDPAGICPNDLSLTGISAQLYELMELSTLENRPYEIADSLTFLTGIEPKFSNAEGYIWE